MVMQDFSEVDVPLAVNYVVSDDGDLVFSDGHRETSRFRTGTWVEVVDVNSGSPLRESWPPDHLDALMDTLLYELVVRFGQGGYETSRSRSKYVTPLFNDFDAFVEELMKDEGIVPPCNGSRQWFERAVSTTFGVVPPRRGRRPPRRH